jgi:membrane protein
MWFRTPIPWSTVIRRTIREVDEDQCVALAAQLAFYFLLALFPALLFLVALLAYLPVEHTLSELVATLGTVAPPELVELLRAQLAQIGSGSAAGVITFGILGAIWSSSAAMVAIIDALNHAYDITERRPWWKRRLVAISLTIALAVFSVVALALVLAGPAVAAVLARSTLDGGSTALLWNVLRWLIMLGSVLLALDLVYHFAPNRRGRWTWLTPGAVVATVLWILSSFAFKAYLSSAADYSATYGAIGGAIVTMLWFYLSGLAMLVGAELNGVIESSWRQRSSAQDGLV